MLSPFIDSSVDFNQSLLEFISISKRRPIDPLLHDTANIVSEQTASGLLGPQIRGDEIYGLFLFISMHIFLVLLLQVVQKKMLGEVGT